MAEATLISVAAGTTVTRETKNLGSIAPFSVQASPTSGGTALVEVTCYPDPIAAGASATWIQWGAGEVNESTLQVIVGAVTGIRFTATTEDATFAISGENLAKYLVGLRDTFSSISRTGLGPLMLLSADVPDASAANIGQEIIVVDENGGQRKISNGASWVDSAAPVNAGEIQTSTWALRGSGTLYQKKIITDIGNQPVEVIWDGTYWQPAGGAQTIYRLPAPVAGAASANSSSPTATMTVPGGLMNIRGTIEVFMDYYGNTTPTGSFAQITFGASDLFSATTLGTKRNVRVSRNIKNTNANAQVVRENADDLGGIGLGAGAVQTFTKNTANDQTITGFGRLTHASSIICTLNSFEVVWRV